MLGLAEGSSLLSPGKLTLTLTLTPTPTPTLTPTLTRSLDDGDTWTDETGDNLVTMGAGGGQWFEDVLYLNSGGQGIMRKKMED